MWLVATVVEQGVTDILAEIDAFDALPLLAGTPGPSLEAVRRRALVAVTTPVR